MGRRKKPDSEKASKQGVSLDAECREILRQILAYELTQHNDMAQAQAIRKCIRIAWEMHYRQLLKSEVSVKSPQAKAIILQRAHTSSVSSKRI